MSRPRAVALFPVVTLLFGACASAGGDVPSGQGKSSVAEASSVSPSGQGTAFPVAAFTDISEDPIPGEKAGDLQAVLSEMAGRRGGMTATVMTPSGTWSGATGTADGVREMHPDDQFAIGSVTKSVIAAQVMQLVESGQLALDDPVGDHLPAGLDFDTNRRATIRDLLGMRSGIPDYVDELWKSLTTDRKRRWTSRDVLDLVAADRSPPGGAFEYSSTNYVLLGLIIEEVSGRPLADVLRDGVLSIGGVERLIYQPDERPTEPMAMPDGESAALKKGGGYLPSIAGATAAGPAGAMASDAPSLARWWRALCAGEIVSQASLNEMTTLDGGYGLGLYAPYGGTVGHAGEHVGYVSWAGCLPEDGGVIVVLSNRVVENVSGIAAPLVTAVTSD